MIHVSRNNRQEGPYSEDEIRRKISNGEIAVTDLGWRQGLANWTRLSELLDIKAPPPLPAPVATARPPPGSVKPPPIRSSPAVINRATILSFLVCGFGLLGAYCDISVARAINEKIQAGYTDFNSVVNSLAWYWQVLLEIAKFFIPKSWQTEGEQVVHAFRTAANILMVCGWMGGITAVLFWLRRYVKILALLLMLCGVAPLMFDTKPLGFAGLPMALAGFIGLFVRGKQGVAPIKA
jgi:GYF domain 2